MAEYDDAVKEFEKFVKADVRVYEPAMTEAKSQLHDLLDVLRETRVEGQIEVFFSGGGDQGQIDEVYGVKDPDICHEVELWSEKLLTCTDADWFNNAGGSGQLIIDIDQGTCEYFIHVNTEVLAVEEKFS